PDHDLSWHNVDGEFGQFAIEQLKEVGTLIFGQRTYELMASFWPSKEAKKDDPETAKLMTKLPKIVFSHSEIKPEWENTTWLSDVEKLRQLKKQAGKDLAVFGSSNLCLSLIENNLLDELRIMVNPVIIGQGTSLFTGIKQKLNLDLTKTRQFKNGNVLLNYQLKS